ncbi:type I-F CRISPR-associated endoribonuclease Cas6/Csy4 [Pseudorhodoferax sp. LjRoot39]|uniref:type I-F CRISPR-associated endoribonuclease Cas6/Csy4 n=1 Tax=Pseudorhodoferax sp. LjRoot39 TaxID=3342328 RepID=UPI003ECCE222
MDHYVDLRVRPDPELIASHVMDVLFGRLHLTLAARRTGDIGASFPGVASGRTGLGDVLRLHGSAGALEALMETRWLAGLLDHVQAGDVAAVPPGASYRVVRRVQAKSSAERIRRRQMRRHGYDAAQARERVPDSVERTLALPYVRLRSASTGQIFRLFVDHGPLQAAPQPGSFSAYGLSPHATVPWF